MFVLEYLILIGWWIRVHAVRVGASALLGLSKGLTFWQQGNLWVLVSSSLLIVITRFVSFLSFALNLLANDF